MTWQSDLHRWDHTSRILHPRRGQPWWVIVALVVWILLCAAGIALGAPRCPTWDACWQAELRCEATPARNWKPCRRVVRRCFARWERC